VDEWARSCAGGRSCEGAVSGHDAVRGLLGHEAARELWDGCEGTVREL